jgi:osmoprotectant transport system permease protein
MRELNAAVVIDKLPIAAVATGFLQSEGLLDERTSTGDGIWTQLRRNTLRHLQLTVIALVMACVAGTGLALAVYRSGRAAGLVLYLAGLIQTVPSIALLALMIPLLGVGMLPAIVALFLYSLLPILRNAITALTTIDPVYRRVAEAMGLTRRQQLRYVLMPLAYPHILAGIRTAAVISIGTATLAAFIGAGGLGEPIVTGLALNNTSLILQGAIPAALLAVATEIAFSGLERQMIPRHIRQSQ